MQRRILFNTTALIAVGGLVACTGTAGATPTVLSVMNQIQFVLPLLDVLALGISVAVPAAAPFLVPVGAALANAGPIFQALSSAMTVAEAQPQVQKISGYVNAALDAIIAGVTAAGPNSKAAQFAPQISQARTVVGLIEAFVTGVTAMPTAARGPMPALLHR